MPKVPKIKSFTLYLGIDPGKQGGLAWVDFDGHCYDYAFITESHYDLLNTIKKHADKTTHCVIEQVSTRPGEGHMGAFTFGVGYGRLLMALTACSIAYSTKVPRSWQAALSIPVKGKQEPKPKFKERLRIKAQTLFPKLDLWEKTLGKQRAICDALLIAEFCRRTHRGLKDV